MDIKFKNTKLRKIFNSEKELIKEYGKEKSKLIKLRMAVLRAASTLNDVPQEKPDRCHELKGNRKGTFAVDLKNPFRLTFCPFHDPIPLKEDGGIDLNQITFIKILGVEDYHK